MDAASFTETLAELLLVHMASRPNKTNIYEIHRPTWGLEGR